MNSSTPNGMHTLVQRYHDRQQSPVVYLPGSWERALAAYPDELRILRDDRWTTPTGRTTQRHVERADLARLIDQIDFTDDLAVRQAFVLVMVWGSGTSNTRSYRRVPQALAAPTCTRQLVETATTCRKGDLISAYTGFSLPGVRRSFFTKWFAFSGVSPGRDWQPLILDRRVLNTLNQTFGIFTTELAGDRRWSRRYLAYVQQMHAWSDDLRRQNIDCSAERLEWILFGHNGGTVED